MNNFLDKISILLDKKQFIHLGLSLLLLILTTVLETISLGSIAGFVYMVANPEAVINKLPDSLNFIKIFFLEKNKTQIIFYLLLVLVFFFSVKNILIVSYHYFSGLLKKNIISSNTQKLLHKYLNGDYAFFINTPSQEIINNLNGEIIKCSHYLFYTIILFKEVFLIFSLLLTLLFVSWKLSSLLFLVLGLFSLIFYLVFKKFSKNLGQRVTESSEGILKNITDSIHNAKLIMLLNVKDFFIHKIVKVVEKKNKDLLSQSIINLLPRFILEIIAVTIVAVVLSYFILNNYSFESIISLVTLITLIILRLVPAFSNINIAKTNLKHFENSFENITGQLNKPKYNHDSKIENLSINEIEKKFQSIKVRNLSYQYSNQNNLLLKNINFEIKKGDIVGVIGDSGVGKSTLVNILLGILSPNSGELTLNNKILNKRNFINWQKFVGYVPQETYLMNESIKNNIAFGVDKNFIDDEKVEFALLKANIKNFVDDLEGGKDSLCGENGINMSGGQKQRLGIARAIYRNPEFLIFDEPTSSLDINTEKDLLQDLSTLQEKTIIIVSHRLNVIKACSKILFLDKDGKFDFGEKEEIVKKYEFLKDYN